MKTQSALIAGGIAVVLVIAALIWLATRSAAPSVEETDTTNEPATSQTQNENLNQTQDDDEALAASVSITASGFEPANLTVAPGTTVTWTNNDGLSHMIASDPHPTHGDTPGFESGELAPGATYSFTFDEVKTYNYHNHLNPTVTGSVTVSE